MGFFNKLTLKIDLISIIIFFRINIGSTSYKGYICLKIQGYCSGKISCTIRFARWLLDYVEMRNPNEYIIMLLTQFLSCINFL